jgi:ElaB/YqjD/DUF883 family membrane-anchored ribosome-binding protein
MSTIQDYSTAAAELRATHPEMFIGQMVCFTITEADVLLETVRTEVEARNLSTSTLKKRIRPIDAFKKATREIGKKFPRDGDEQHTILVREVGKDTDTSHRHVVWERAIFKTGQRRRLEYQPLATIVYDRGTRNGDIVENDHVTVNSARPVGLQVPATIEEHLTETMGLADSAKGIEAGAVLRERFQHWCTHLDSHAVRTFVREYIVNNLGGVQIKDNGGFYFVPQKHIDELIDLKAFVAALPKPKSGRKGSNMHLTDLLDIVDQREFIAESFLQDTEDKVRELQVEIKKILDDPKRTITEDTHDEYVARAVALISKSNDYQALLGDHLDTSTLTVEILKQTILGNEFSNRIKKTKSMSRSSTP